MNYIPQEGNEGDAMQDQCAMMNMNENESLERLVHPPPGQDVMSNIMAEMVMPNNKIKEEMVTTSDKIKEEEKEWVDVFSGEAPHSVTRRWNKKGSEAVLPPLHFEKTVKNDQKNMKTADRIYGPYNRTSGTGSTGSTPYQSTATMSFRERAAEYTRIYGNIENQEHSPPPTQSMNPNHATGRQRVQMGDPLIYCCFYLRKGRCRWGERCRYQHFNTYADMDPILQRNSICALCDRQLPTNFKYPCRRHHHPRYA